MNEIQGRFIRLLQQEAEILDNLYALLSEETDILKANDVDNLHEVTSNKHRLLDQLGTLDKQRQLFMDDATLLNNEQFNSEIDELNKLIQSKLNQCRHRNNVNGGMIEVRQQFNTRILNVLHGDSSNESTYGASGSNTEKNKNTIARV